MTQLEGYLSFARHELRNQLVVVREGVSQIMDGFGKGDCQKCTRILKPALECADKLDELIEKFLTVEAFVKDAKCLSADQAGLSAAQAVTAGHNDLERLKKEFVAVINHEVRTPLAVMSEGLSLVRDQVAGSLTSQQVVLLADVATNMDRLIGALDKILKTPLEDCKTPVREDTASGYSPAGGEMKQRKVMVVDDEVNFLKVMKTRLEESGFNVVTLSESAEVPEAVCREKPDAVLLDILMPGMDGLAVLKKIREENTALPIFIMTSAPNEERFKEAQCHGASGFVAKTDDLKKSIQNIASVLNVMDRYKAGS